MKNITKSKSRLISVLMPCYNASEFIRESIDSVLAQTYTNFELILINDGSTDDTQTIIDEYVKKDKRIKNILKRNSGIPDTLNAGLVAAKGEWIARLDADDIAMPTRFKKQMEYIDNHPETVLLGSGCIVIDRHGNEIKKYSYGNGHDEIVSRIERMQSFFPHSSAFFLRNLSQKLGGYNTLFNAGEDMDLWLRLSNAGPIACLPEPLIQLRKHSDCITLKKWKHYVIFGMAVTICNLRTKLGLTRPSEMGEVHWNNFLQWIEDELENRGYFEDFARWEEVRTIWSSSNVNPFAKWCHLFLKVLRYPTLLVKKTKRKVFGSNLPRKLAKESKLNWPS